MPAAPSTSSRPVADSPGSPLLRRITAITAVAAAAAAVALFLAWYGNRHHFFDLYIYMNAMDWWAAGNPLYDYRQADAVQGELYFTYPPFTALLLRPFAALPLNATIAVFTLLTGVATAVTAWWLVTPVADRRGIPRWFAAGLAIPLAFATENTRETLAFGQINMVLIVLILADLLFAVPRNSRWSGVGIGLATALKLFPGIFIIYLLAARKWRAAAVASATALGATLLSAAVAPADSWQFWTHELWATDRVGRTDYTGNQSLLGLLSRLAFPGHPSKTVWLVVVVAVTCYGLWRAGRAATAGDAVAGLTLAGLVGALVSPITWPHHLFWFVPAVVVLIDAALPERARHRTEPGPATSHGLQAANHGLLVLAVGTYTAAVYGVVSFPMWGFAPEPLDSPDEWILRNLHVLLALLLLMTLPTRRNVAARGGR